MKLSKELPIWIIILVPAFYLLYSWENMAEKVPLHWNLQGEVDRYGDKQELIYVALLLPFVIYLLLLIVPKIDPKNKIRQMGGKYYNLRFLMTAFMAALAVFLVHSAQSEGMTNPNLILGGVGLLYFILGNYFKALKPNYFIGIRTPWTLESPEVWRKTHRLGGILWFIGGIIVVLSSLLLNNGINFIVFFSITALITLIPLIYSYVSFQHQKKLQNEM